MELVDANILLRFILNDNQEMADIAEGILAKKSGFVIREVFAEMVYVLTKVYKIPRQETAVQIAPLLDYLETDSPDIVRYALSLFSETKLDFVDCVLLAFNHLQGAKVTTFDKDILKRLR